MSSVLPSGADLATASAEMLPPAPGRFSTSTVRPPSARPSSWASRRAMVSVVPPGGAPTRMRTGTAVPWAKARPVAAMVAASSRARRESGDGYFMGSDTEVSLAQAVGRKQLRAGAGELHAAVLHHISALRDLQRLRDVLFHQQD